MYHQVPSDEENVTIEKRGQKKYYISYGVIAITLIALVAVNKEWNGIKTVHFENNTEYFVHEYEKEGFKFSWVGFLVPTIMYFFSRFLARLYIMCEECFHLETRYQGNLKEMISVCLKNFFHLTDFFPIFMYFLKELYMPEEIYSYFEMYLLYMVCWASVQIHWDHIEIKEDIAKIPSIGNIWANGAWSAYYKNIFEDIHERINIFEKDHHITIALKKLILLFPMSCDVRGIVDHHDSDIKYVDNLPHVHHDQGANINRTYKNPVYKIGSSNEEPIYVVLEQPSSLFTLWKMREAKKMEKEWINYQRDRYLETLIDKVENYPCIILKYNDNEDKSEKLSIFLRRNILNLVEDRSSLQLIIQD